MKGLLSDYIKVGIVFEMAFPNCQRERQYYRKCLDLIEQNEFYQAVEVTHIKEESFRKEICDRLKASRLAVAYCAQPVLLGEQLNLNDPDIEKRRRAVARMKECIDEAYEMGAESFSFLAGTYSKDRLGEAYLALSDSIRQMCSYAGNRLQIEIEIFDYDLDKCSLIGPSKRAARLAGELRPEYVNFWLLPDLSHIPQQHETIEESLDLVMPYMRRTHIGNCVVDKRSPVFGDQHPPFSYPESCIGTAELTKYLQILIDNDILTSSAKPMVSFEVKPLADQEIEKVLKENERMLLQACSKLNPKQERKG